MFLNCIAVGAGGFLGAVSRYLMGMIPFLQKGSLPYHTPVSYTHLDVYKRQIYPRVLRIRGLKCSTLIKLVHSLGGILGPAHPFGVATSSAMGFKKMKMSYIKHFDFIETFNTCEFVNSNRLAKDLADRFDMPSFAGSDAHVPEYIGMACTEINAQIHCCLLYTSRCV